MSGIKSLIIGARIAVWLTFSVWRLCFWNTNFSLPPRTTIISTSGIIPVQKSDMNPSDPTKPFAVTNYIEKWLKNHFYLLRTWSETRTLELEEFHLTRLGLEQKDNPCIVSFPSYQT
jgi:hypothetical protein